MLILSRIVRLAEIILIDVKEETKSRNVTDETKALTIVTVIGGKVNLTVKEFKV